LRGHWPLRHPRGDNLGDAQSQQVQSSESQWRAGLSHSFLKFREIVDKGRCE
jgi:hypothetical protein